LVFILDNFVYFQTVDTLAPRDHEAVEGFFSAPQERAVYTSFEGGNKSGAPAEDC
jgi:hypothetical protein